MNKAMTPYFYDLCHAPSSIIVSGIFHHVILSTTFFIYTGPRIVNRI